VAALQPGDALQRGTFVIVSEIGRGGYGAVYRAHQARLERDVAIKVLHPQHDDKDDTVVRFRREALATASLSHPNVLPVFDFDFDQELGLWFLVMQYVPGGRSLEDVPTPLEPFKAAQLIGGIAGALDAAHLHGIIHRDVKPANVLLDGERPLLTDFGIAYLGTVTAITGIGVAIGTPAFMSPEQALGREVVPQSDQYALGVMAYSLLLGRLPFEGAAPALLYQHVHEPVPPLDTVDPRFPAPLAAAVRRAMSNAPEERFPSCTEFANALALASTTAPGPGVAGLQRRVARDRPPGDPYRNMGIAARSAPAVAEPDVAVEAPLAPPAPEPPSKPMPAAPRGSRRPLLAGATLVVLVILVAIATLRGTNGAPAEATRTGRPGEVLLADNFDAPSAGFLPAAAPAGAPFRAHYIDGEYELTGPSGAFVALPGTYRDSGVAFDVRITGDPVGRAIGVACRASEQGWYQLTVIPDTRTFGLARLELSGASTVLIPDQVSPAIQRTASNHIEYACAGTTIAASANGVLLASVEDDSLAAGWYQISVLGLDETPPPDGITARLDNLAITQR
jgi:tRNA A-37 threonylcarbamoyl transferase component Bud32